MTRCSITCMDPDCNEKIFYGTDTDTEVNIYCYKHRTKEGRHAAKRKVR